MREAALAVIRKDDHVAVGDHFPEIGELVEQHFVAGRGLEVDAKHLLMRLRSRAVSPSWRFRRSRCRCVLTPAFSRSSASVRPGSSSPTTESSATFAPSAAALTATFAAPPGVSFGALDLDLHYGHRRLRRNTLHLAEPVAIEHHVAHHEDRAPCAAPTDTSFSAFTCPPSPQPVRSDSTPGRSASSLRDRRGCARRKPPVS